jgi:hypothetical protein
VRSSGWQEVGWVIGALRRTRRQPRAAVPPVRRYAPHGALDVAGHDVAHAQQGGSGQFEDVILTRTALALLGVLERDAIMAGNDERDVRPPVGWSPLKTTLPLRTTAVPAVRRQRPPRPSDRARAGWRRRWARPAQRSPRARLLRDVGGSSRGSVPGGKDVAARRILPRVFLAPYRPSGASMSTAPA